MENILFTALDCLERGECPVLVTVVSRQGSTPRMAGARMLAVPSSPPGGPSRLAAGTVGGGFLEGVALQASTRVMDLGKPEVLDFDLGDEQAAGSDMICGGTLKLYLDPLTPSDISLIEALIRDNEAGLTRHMVSGFAENRRWLPGTPGLDPCPLPLERALLVLGQDQAALLEYQGNAYLVAAWQNPPRIVLAGAGHVALAVFQVARCAGFELAILDDRPEFAHEQRFPGAALVRVVPDFIHCFGNMPVTPHTAIVILTRGHLHDAIVLEQALVTPAGYIGMIGSRRKRDAIYGMLQAKGMSPSRLAQVHSPIGLPIGGQTPGEIAVSVVAEIIRHRHQGRK